MFAGNCRADQRITLDTHARILCGRAIALVGLALAGLALSRRQR